VFSAPAMPEDALPVRPLWVPAPDMSTETERAATLGERRTASGFGFGFRGGGGGDGNGLSFVRPSILIASPFRYPRVSALL